MANATININVRDNVSPVLNQLQNKIRNLQNQTININMRAPGNAGGGGGAGLGLMMIGADIATRSLYSLRDAIINLGKSSLEQARMIEASTKRLAFSYGGKSGAQAQMGKVGEFAAGFGLSKENTIESFSKLAIATKEAGITSQETQNIFENTTKAAAAMGLSADNTKGVFNALTQMLSKGKVSMEELRLQLGDRLPGALALGAKAMNMTLPKFVKQIEDGNVASKEFVLRLTELFGKKYGDSAAENLLTLEGKLNTLENSFFDLKTAIAQSLGPATMRMVESLAKKVESLAEKVSLLLGTPLAQQNKAKVESQLKAQGMTEEEIAKMKPAEREKKLKQTQAGFSLSLQDLNKKIQENPEILGLLDPATKAEIQKSIGLEESFKKTYGGLGANSPTMVAGLEKINKNREKALGQAFRQLEALPQLQPGEEPTTLGGTLNPFGENFGQFTTLGARAISGANRNTEVFRNAGLAPIIENLQAQSLATDRLTTATEDATQATKDLTGDEDKKKKLKTDFHTPRIVNINILTGQGASLISGGMQNDFMAQPSDMGSIRQNIKSEVETTLQEILVSAGTSLARVTMQKSGSVGAP